MFLAALPAAAAHADGPEERGCEGEGEGDPVQ